MVLLQLFLAFFKVGLFAIGGAYSFLPLLEKEVVQNHQWLQKSEFLEVVANVANLLPPMLLMTIASLVYWRYGGMPAVRAALGMVRYAVFAMMIAIAVKLVDTSRLTDLKVLPVVIVAFLLLRLTSVHPAFIIIGAALYGGLLR
jgi:chromate transporter